MTSVRSDAEPSREGDPALVVRAFGWATLGGLAAFMSNNVLTVGFDFPGAAAAFSVGGGLAWFQLGLYAAAFAMALGLVLRVPGRSLRSDAKVISDFNGYLIRGCFWAVLLVGVVDASIAFMRVENLLPLFLGPEMSQEMGRARFVGPYIHVPLIVAGFIVALFSRTLGFTWLALLIVIAELMIVVSRFVFSYEQAMMGDLVRYWYAALFLFASAYTLLHEGHVRVDVLYARYSSQRKGFVNALGSILLGLTTCWVIIVIGFGGKQSIINAPVANFEVSQTGNVGMYIKYQMAAFLGVFAITMLIQFVSYLFAAVADMRGEPGGCEPTDPTH